MKDYSNIVLCSYEDETIHVLVTASIDQGCLLISGYDNGKRVEEIWGDSDYEYWYSFDQKETEKLLMVIHGMDHPEEALKREFSGLDGCRKLRDICDKNHIQYQFDSWI